MGGQMVRNKIARLALGIITVAAVVWVVSQALTQQHEARRAGAQEVSIAAVSAASTADAGALSQLFGRPMNADEAERLRGLMPGFVARSWSEQDPSGATVQVQSSNDPTFAVIVNLLEDASPNGWRVVSMVSVQPK